MTVKKLLSEKGSFVSVIPSDARVRDMMDQLEEDGVSALVVSDNNKSILGIISEKDIIRGLKKFGEDVMDKPVSELMNKNVITCCFDEPMSKIYELMDEHQVHYIPITKNGMLCGIISMLNVVKYRLNEMEQEAQMLKHYITGDAA